MTSLVFLSRGPRTAARFDRVVLNAAKLTSGQSENKALERPQKDSDLPESILC